MANLWLLSRSFVRVILCRVLVTWWRSTQTTVGVWICKEALNASYKLQFQSERTFETPCKCRRGSFVFVSANVHFAQQKSSDILYNLCRIERGSFPPLLTSEFIRLYEEKCTLITFYPPSSRTSKEQFLALPRASFAVYTMTVSLWKV